MRWSLFSALLSVPEASRASQPCKSARKLDWTSPKLDMANHGVPVDFPTDMGLPIDEMLSLRP
jgi:hypothetical protein